MSNFWAKNIGGWGRVWRGCVATALLIGGIATAPYLWWLSALLFISSAFVFFEAARGWCVMRACAVRRNSKRR